MADLVRLDAALVAWLASDEHDVGGWQPEPPIDRLRCHPDLVARVDQVARPQRGACRVWVAGVPVVHHPAGAPIAFAQGTSVLAVRSAQPPGALASRWSIDGLDPSWVSLDPWAADVTFAKTLEMLRAHVARAYRRASEPPRGAAGQNAE
jgi:hypothetical protein